MSAKDPARQFTDLLIQTAGGGGGGGGRKRKNIPKTRLISLKKEKKRRKKRSHFKKAINPFIPTVPYSGCKTGFVSLLYTKRNVTCLLLS